MLKIIAATFMFAASAAVASPHAGRACSAVAESSVTVARSAELGVPWKTVEDVHSKVHTSPGKATDVVLAIQREAYYRWANLGPSNVRTLAYTKCMQELPDAVREDNLK